MDTSPNLALPYIAAAQAQKHVTHNEAIRALDAVVQLSVLDRGRTAPPATPSNGQSHIVAAPPTGAWTGQFNCIASYQDGAWIYYTPRVGWLAWVTNEGKLVVWDGTSWVPAVDNTINPVALLGVNTIADATNRLAVAAPNTLLSHDGNDHRLKINKASGADTASLLLQDNFSARAEFGLTGDDNLHVKVSEDGTLWQAAIIIDRTNGRVAFPLGGGVGQNLLINGDFQINQRAFIGGSLTAGSFGHDRWKSDTGGANYNVTGYAVTLASGKLVQVIEPNIMCGVASLASTQLVVSVDTPSADIIVTVGSASATITAGSGRRAATLTTAAGDTGNLAVKLANATVGSVTFARVKIETGSIATAWVAQTYGVEFALCARYFQTTYEAVSPGSIVASGAINIVQYTQYPLYQAQLRTKMRAAPTVTVYSPSTGADGFGRHHSGTDIPLALTSFTSGSVVIYVSTPLPAGEQDIRFHYTASAEL